MKPGKKIFFASDLHLGVPDREKSLEREKHFVNWLDSIKSEAGELILLGDVFDFWFEYKRAVPKGFTRLFGKLAEFQDAGIQIHYFTGNHDLWIGDYFQAEFGAQVHREPQMREFFGKRFYYHHGDGLGPGDLGYKFLKKIFTNPFLQWAFARLHPNFGIGIADYFSRRSRKKSGLNDAVDFGEKEFLLIHARKVLREMPEIDYFVFGHRHFPMEKEIGEEKYYINLGDWISHFTYLEVGPEKVELKKHPLGRTAAG